MDRSLPALGGASAPGGGPVLPRLTSSNGSGLLQLGGVGLRDARDSCSRGGAADLDDRRADARERRRLRRAEVGVVDAGDRDVVGDPHAGLAAREHRADGEHVVGRDHRRRRGRARPAARASPPFPIRARSGRSERASSSSVEAVPRRARRARRRRARVTRSLPAVGALISAEAPMAELDQVLRHRVGRRAVVEADARMQARADRRPRSARTAGRSCSSSE